VRRPGWLLVGLGTATGFFVGVFLVIALGGPQSGGTKTVTRFAHSITTGIPIVVKVRVPAVVGLGLDDAKSRLGKAGFHTDVQGESFLDKLFGGGYRVTAQSPGPTVFLVRGGTVQLQVESS
jgi:beta-lactam-binding protein with PASTA domain